MAATLRFASATVTFSLMLFSPGWRRPEPEFHSHHVRRASIVPHTGHVYSARMYAPAVQFTKNRFGLNDPRRQQHRHSWRFYLQSPAAIMAHLPERRSPMKIPGPDHPIVLTKN